MRKPNIKLHQDRQNKFWLWDETRKMNLSMRAETKEDALLETIYYYQNRLLEVEQKYKELNQKVESFLVQFKENNEDC